MNSITMTRAAGADHQVVTVEGCKSGTYRRRPCAQCPWRKDAVGVFPAEAFVHSANTAYDMSEHMFGCHDSGTSKPAACAGFLLHGAHHNLAVRLQRVLGRIRDDVTAGGVDLHQSYKEMAIANGVDRSDSHLLACR